MDFGDGLRNISGNYQGRLLEVHPSPGVTGGISMLTRLSTSSAFFNMDVVDFNHLDVDSFDFEMVYVMDILAMKYGLVLAVMEV